MCVVCEQGINSALSSLLRNFARATEALKAAENMMLDSSEEILMSYVKLCKKIEDCVVVKNIQ